MKRWFIERTEHYKEGGLDRLRVRYLAWVKGKDVWVKDKFHPNLALYEKEWDGAGQKVMSLPRPKKFTWDLIERFTCETCDKIVPWNIRWEICTTGPLERANAGPFVNSGREEIYKHTYPIHGKYYHYCKKCFDEIIAPIKNRLPPGEF